MANLPEVDEFTAGVYQWETTDPAEAGPGGVMNTPLKALTNRTLWLKNQLAGLVTTVSGIAVSLTSVANRVTNLEAVQPKTLFFLRKATVSLGDAVNPGPDDIITISFSTVGTANYMVAGSLVSKSASYDTDNDVIWCIRSKTATSFQICLKEVSSNIQNLDFDYVLIPF